MSWNHVSAPPLALSHPASVSFNLALSLVGVQDKAFTGGLSKQGFHSPDVSFCNRQTRAGVSQCVWKFIFSVK